MSTKWKRSWDARLQTVDAAANTTRWNTPPAAQVFASVSSRMVSAMGGQRTERGGTRNKWWYRTRTRYLLFDGSDITYSRIHASSVHTFIHTRGSSVVLWRSNASSLHRECTRLTAVTPFRMWVIVVSLTPTVCMYHGRVMWFDIQGWGLRVDTVRSTFALTRTTLMGPIG